ncbi:MAG: MFS transporter [Christensenellales bacterium]
MTELSSKRFTKKERSWIMYDWANSVYATNIMAAIFPTIFVAYAGDQGDLWWGYGTSFATLIVAILAPLLGSIADYQGMKKKMFTAFMLLGVCATALIALTNDWRFMLVAYVVSKIGFTGSNLFYDSFLTDVTTNERMDKVSSWGYAMGYIGGSTIPFVISIAVLIAMGYSSPFAQKFAILITSVWWLVFTIPFLKNVEQVHYIERPDRISFRHAFDNVLKTAGDIAKSRGMLLFILSYFFYIDGVGTVISISTAYGTALGLGATGMILALLVTQLVAMPCSILFAKLTHKTSTRKALLLAIAVYMFICLVGFYMGFSLEPHQDAYNEAYAQEQSAIEESYSGYSFEDSEAAHTFLNGLMSSAKRNLTTQQSPIGDFYVEEKSFSSEDLALIKQAGEDINKRLLSFKEMQRPIITRYQDAIAFSTILFWCMAVLVGTVQGGIQAVSRSYFGKLVPKKRSNEYFGFFDIFGKFATVVGPFLYALVGGLTGRSSFGALCLVLLFLAGFIILIAARKPLDELEAQRAIQVENDE